jgi:DNA-binding transcriptional LysR family regulator
VTLELSDRIADMVPEAIDLCLRFGPSPTNSAIVSRVIARPSAGLYASAAYLKAHGTPRVPADLCEHRTLGVGWLKLSPTWVLQGLGGTAQLSLKPSLLSNDIQILVSAAIQGCGILMAPHFVCLQERLPETLLQVLPEWESDPVQLRALYPSRQSLTPLLRAFIDLLADRASKALNIQPHHGSENST